MGKYIKILWKKIRYNIHFPKNKTHASLKLQKRQKRYKNINKLIIFVFFLRSN